MAATRTLSRWGVVTLATIVFGPVLAIAAAAAQVVLAPPWLTNTGTLYWALSAAGLPVLIVGLVMRRIRGWHWLGAVALLGVLLIVLTVLLSPVMFALENCRAEPAQSVGVRRYVCDYRTYQQSVIEYVIEGPDGWPLARIIEVR